jgi:uncharacterized protein (TIGR03083 family)
VYQNLGFPDRLRLLEEQAAVLRATVASAPSLDAQVPTCPGWTLWDLVQHMGAGQCYWGAVVAAGPADAPPGGREDFADAAPKEREPLLAWSATATRRMVDAFRDAGADAPCWTWWEDSESPQTAGAVAWHQLVEMSVHIYDAQVTVGDGQPVPTEVALDAIGDILSTGCATSSAWPHEPAELDFVAAEGPAWRLSLSADGARSARLPQADAAPADATMRGTAHELVMTFYDRLQIADAEVDGPRRLFELLRDWEPE